VLVAMPRERITVPTTANTVNGRMPIDGRPLEQLEQLTLTSACNALCCAR